jgi:hypothetical protein
VQTRYEPAFLALYSAQRFLVASIMRFLPAALSLRFLVTAFAAGASFTFFVAAYLLRWASDIRALVAALNRRRLRAGAEGAADSVDSAGIVAADLGGRPLRFDPSARIPSMERTCSMWLSIICFCASKPASAAFSTSELNSPVCIGMTPIMTQAVTHLGYVAAVSGTAACHSSDQSCFFARGTRYGSGGRLPDAFCQ